MSVAAKVQPDTMRIDFTSKKIMKSPSPIAMAPMMMAMPLRRPIKVARSTEEVPLTFVGREPHCSTLAPYPIAASQFGKSRPGNMKHVPRSSPNYRMRLTSSVSISLPVVTVRLEAWKPRCEVII